jgi:hypothetical protein
MSEDAIGLWRPTAGGAPRLDAFAFVARREAPRGLGAPSCSTVLPDGSTLVVGGRSRGPGAGTPLIDLSHPELATTVELGGSSVGDLTAVVGVGAHSLAASTRSRVWLWDVRCAHTPCARLEVRETCALASVGELWLLTANGHEGHGVLVYDVRKVENDKKAKPPPPVATLTTKAERPNATMDAARTTPAVVRLAAVGSTVAAADGDGGLHGWELGPPLDQSVVEVVGEGAAWMRGLGDIAEGVVAKRQDAGGSREVSDASEVRGAR